MSGDLPPPHVLAALGTVLCLYPSQARHELAGWTRAVRAACDSRLDSDGLCESVQFYDRDGLCCWRLCVLPDTDLPQLSRVGADVARRWVREQGIECGALIDDCCCCRTMATQRAETGDQHRHDTRIPA